MADGMLQPSDLEFVKHCLFSSSGNYTKQELLIECQPWHPKVQKVILASIHKYNWIGENYAHFETFQRKMKPNLILQPKNLILKINQIEARGNSSYVYSATLLMDYGPSTSKQESGELVAVKSSLLNNMWEVYIAITIQKRLLMNSRRRGLKDFFCRVKNFSTFYNGSSTVSELCELGTLEDMIRIFRDRGRKIPDCVVLFITFQILFAVNGMHCCGIVHGNLTPDHIGITRLLDESDASGNFFNKPQCIKLFGFSQAIDLELFKPGTEFKYRHELPHLRCPVMRENSPWLYQQDYFFILRTVHEMLCNEPLKIVKYHDTWEPKTDLDETRSGEVWNTLFHDLLNCPNTEQGPNLLYHCFAISRELIRMEEAFLKQIQNFHNILPDD